MSPRDGVNGARRMLFAIMGSSDEFCLLEILTTWAEVVCSPMDLCE